MMATGTSTATNGNGVDVPAGSVVGPVGMLWMVVMLTMRLRLVQHLGYLQVK